jgi:hypothetical protein
MTEIIINGVGGSGKDTFITLLSEKFGKDQSIFNYSSIDPFRNIPRVFGWGGQKDDSYRNCLHYLKKASSCIDDFPIRHLMEMRSNHTRNSDIIFYHIREPEEIEKFVKALPNTPITVLVTREGGTVPDNPGDRSVFDYHYDYVIENNGNLAELGKSAETFMKDIL